MWFALAVACTAPLVRAGGQSSPPGGDTTGYWQQRVAYTIVATLDETAQRLRARGTMRYVNHSPDTLREMYVHQYLNAFRPRSLWSRQDERMAVERFQDLPDPHHGYERFTAPVRVNGAAVVVSYPGAPDSTVVRFALPTPLPPGDSLLVQFEWEARPSTLPRRQGRRGRHWDFAQWYPRVAVYDRGGWQDNALQPAGEFYGEFGTFDVTLVVRDDQVIGATGVPVAGDPGWHRVRRAGSVASTSAAYREVPPAPPVDVPPGHRAVRFLARDVHHFAWSASPDYRYEGGAYVRAGPGTRAGASPRWPTWDTVAIHVLYRPGDDSTWGGLRAVQRTANALQWLELIFGEYAYPQMTVLHRIEGGGTEFPMLQMNGSPSQGLILHEGGHVWVHGILANNEWRSGWMDEGLTSYQTEWAQQLTPQERLRAGIEDRFREPARYRGLAVTPRMSRFDAIGLTQALTDLTGGAQPIGTTAHRFRDFDTYSQMIYNRAQVMYGQLRDVLGDPAFTRFLRTYYARWALRHVDEAAMRAAAEAAHDGDLGWFFDQWVHRTGVMDYALEGASWTRSDSGWTTAARVRRRGAYAHPVGVGVRTREGWVVVPLGDPLAVRQVVRVVSRTEPLEVRLDPFHFSWDWDRRNDVAGAAPRVNVDWPLLRQSDRERTVVLWRPTAWYSDPGGATGGLRLRSSYLELIDRREAGVAYATRTGKGTPASSALQYWIRTENPSLPVRGRPFMGWSAGVARLDDVLAIDVGYARDRTVGAVSLHDAFTLTYTDPLAPHLLPELWADRRVLDVAWRSRSRRELAGGGSWRYDASAVAGIAASSGFARVEAATGRLFQPGESTTLGVRIYAGLRAGEDVTQRGLFVSAQDPVATFARHWWRPRDAVLKQVPGWLPLGGAAARGFRWDVTAERQLAAANLDLAQAIGRLRRGPADVEFRLHLFADATAVDPERGDNWLSDAGTGLSVRGRLYDRAISLRIDAPVYASDPALAIDRGRAGPGRFAPRWVVTTDDIW